LISKDQLWRSFLRFSACTAIPFSAFTALPDQAATEVFAALKIAASICARIERIWYGAVDAVDM